MKVAFRVDASALMGTGHLMRCVALAEALRARGADPMFITREHPGHLMATVRERRFPLVVLPAPDSPPEPVARDDYAMWLGVPPGVDADQTVRALAGQDAEWLVCDHYGLNRAWEQQVRPKVGQLLVLEDMANRPHECDVLLDQNYSTEGESRHRVFVPEGCAVLSGPRYALLSPEYARGRQAGAVRDGAVRRVLVYFGGVDSLNMTGRALAVLAEPTFSHLAVDVVIGANHAHREPLRAQAADRPRTFVHDLRPHLADLMGGADLAIGAGGTTTWERMCLGLPSLVISIAENQRATCEALAADGLVDYIGATASADAAAIRSALARLLDTPARLAELSGRGSRLVDGLGAERVANVLTASREADPLRAKQMLHDADVRPGSFGEFSFAWLDRCRADAVIALRNMPHVRSQMRSQEIITAEDHRRFLDQYPHLDRYDFMLIDGSNGRYVGAFYVTNLSTSAEIGKYIGDSSYLGQGIARQAMGRLLEFCRSRAGLQQLVSTTRVGNARNIALNAALGFKPTGVPRDGYLTMLLEL